MEVTENKPEGKNLKEIVRHIDAVGLEACENQTDHWAIGLI
jgi:hypothetical protein